MNCPLLRCTVYFFTLCCLGFGLAALPAASFAATQDIGKVIVYTLGATVLRDGKTETLALHAGIRVSDTVQTDAAGRVKILFNDDSSVSLGPNTTMDMNEYADAGDKSAFGVNVPQGMIRAITGKIVDQNPDGFKMTSPEATVGIRGTIVTMQVRKNREGQGETTVYVENTLRRVYANGENVLSGNKWIHSRGASRQERITSEDRRHIGKELAFRGGSGTAAAAPEATRDGGQRSPTERFQAGQTWNRLPPDTPLADIALGTQGLGDTLLASTGSLTGRVSGSLGAPGLNPGLSGAFSFDVNLSSGAINNGTFSLSGTSTGTNFGTWNVNMTGGTGSVGSSSFSMNAFAPGATIGGTLWSNVSAVVRGYDNLLSIPAGPLPSGVNYDVLDSSSTLIDTGSGTGSITK